jgi:hypothetical protein
MRLLKRAAVVAAAPLLSLGVLAGLSDVTASAQVVHASSAGALASLSGCGSHSFCMWRNSGYSGTQWSYNYNTRPHDRLFYAGNGANNKASSFYNNRGFRTFITKNFPTNGIAAACVEPGSRVPNLAGKHWQNGTKINDSISGVELDSNDNPAFCSTTF